MRIETEVQASAGADFQNATFCGQVSKGLGTPACEKPALKRLHRALVTSGEIIVAGLCVRHRLSEPPAVAGGSLCSSKKRAAAREAARPLPQAVLTNQKSNSNFPRTDVPKLL